MIGAAEAGEAYGSFQSKLSMCCHEDRLVEVVVVVGQEVIEMDAM